MQDILATSNPLYQVGVSTDFGRSPSPSRDHPPAAQQLATPVPASSPIQNDKKPDASNKQKTKLQKLRGCCKSVPWMHVLCAALTAGALIVWSLHTDKVVDSLLSLLALMRAPSNVSAGISQFASLLKIVAVAAISAVVGLLLVLAVVRERQILIKRKALRYSDWPHGWKMHVFVMATAFLLVLLWLVCAALICLLCLAATSGGVAYVGDIAATRALRLFDQINATAAQSSMTNTIQRLGQAADEFNSSMSSAPAQLRSAPWFGGLQRNVSQVLGNATRDLEVSSYCPDDCMDLSPIATLMPGTNSSNMNTCICGKAVLRELEKQMNQTWRDGLATCIALGVLLLSASWLLLHGVYNCVSARRDHQDAVYFSKQHNEIPRDSRIRNWMRSSYSPVQGTGGGSGGSHFDVKADQRRQTQLLAPELRSSISPRKSSFKNGFASSRDDDWPAPRDVRTVEDIEQPPARRSDQWLPTATPVESSIVNMNSLGAGHTADTLRSSVGPTTETLRSSVGSNRSRQQSHRPYLSPMVSTVGLGMTDTLQGTVSSTSTQQESRRRWKH